MAYGNKVEEKKLPSVGIIDNVEITGDNLFNLSEDSNYAIITFVQPDGSSIITRIWDNEQEDSQKETNNFVHHICTKIVSKEEYEVAVEGSTGFVDFINKVNRVTKNQYQDKKFRELFHYNKKGYVTTPRFAPFFESMDVTLEKSSIHKFLNTPGKSSDYVKKMMVRPEQPVADAEPVNSENVDDPATNNLPF